MNIMDISFNSSVPGYSYTLQSKEDKSSRVESSEKTSQVEELSKAEKAQVRELQVRDAEVKAHEAAHQGGGGGAATYTFQQGPDGKMYAIGGEVSISLKTGSTPEETIANAMQVLAAATAPANPSSQDMSVAATAKSMIIKAQQEKIKEVMESTQGHDTYKEQSVKGIEVDSNKEGTNPIAALDISA